MRDLIIVGLIGWTVWKAFKHPWIGILGWTWISIMNPHQLSWNLSSQPVAAAVGGATLVGLFATRDKRDFSFRRENAVLLLFMVWMCITLPTSVLFDPSFELWKRVMKIDLMVLVAMVVLHTKRHTVLLIWVLVISIGFYGVKGGVFTLATGGSYRVWGPYNTYIEGNNEVALAFVIVIPLMRFLQMQLSERWARNTMGVCMGLMAISALGSHSRGALLALFAMGVVMWWRGNKKMQGALIFLIGGAVMLSLMPAEWWERMNTIKTYEQDGSALGRINAWWMAFNLAKANFLGGGFMVSHPLLFQRYAPDPNDVHAAHSIYFMVLGEHGFVGLFLFILMFCLVWGTAGRLRVQGRKQPETQWVSDLGAMCQVSLAGYAVGGAFLSLSYWDLPYNVLIAVVVGARWLDRKQWLREPQEPMLNLPEWIKKRLSKRKPKPKPATLP